MQTDIVYASQVDTLASIKDKIKNHETNRICLVLPIRHLLFNPAQLNIIRSYVANLGCELAIVTRQFTTLQYAKQLNIQYYPSIRRARKSTWYTYDKQAQLDLHDNPTLHKNKKDLATLKQNFQKTTTSPKISRKMRILLLSLVLIAFFALAFYLIPSATVFITPTKEVQSVEIPLLNQNGENAFGNLLPINTTTLTITTESQLLTTGQIEIPHTTATGTIEFTNISNAPVQIPAGTTLYAIIDEEQILVETIDSITLPAPVGSTIQTDIIAANPGAQGNLPAQTIVNVVGDLSFYLTATNPLAMRGGSDQITKAPSKDDYAQLRTQTNQQAQTQAIQKFTENSPQDVEIIQITLKNPQETFIPEVQSAANQLNLTLQTDVEIQYVTTSALLNAINLTLDAQLSPNFTAIPTSLHYEKTSQTEQSTYLVTRLTTENINIPELIQTIAGKTKPQAQQILQTRFSSEANPQIIFKPNFLNQFTFYRLPWFPARIYIELR